MTNQHLQPGALLQAGKYRIEKILGQGGFGITYLATQELLNRRVAVKEFFMRDFCSRAQDTATVTLGTDANREQMERYLAKFLKEAKVIAQLDHPGIIRIYDIFEENGTAYYVMEYIDGESLSQLVKRRGALPEQEAIEYIRSVAEALKHVHSLGINHLDVKPGNIMVRRKDGRVFLLDFGLSKQYDAEGNQTSSTPLGISHGYAPIEQYTPGGMKEFSPQTDIYALGATLYYLVTGVTPPAAGELFTHKLEGFPPAVSSALRRAIGKAMRQQREDRPATVEKFEALLPAQRQPKKKSGRRRPSKDNPKADDETTRLNPEADETPEGEGTPRRNGFGRFFQSNRKKIAFIGAGVIALAIVCGVIYTSQPSYIHKQALKAYEAGNYDTAFKKFRQAAEKGYADSQYRLGEMYANGEGTTQNDTTAIEWYTRAAEQGVPGAQNNLGEMYESGYIVPQDYAKAFELYTQAAETYGYGKAQYNLGEMYYYGRGVPKNYEEALKQYRRAAQELYPGYAPAQYKLGELYENGIGVLEDETKAAEWYAKAAKGYKKAAEQGDAEAQFDLGYMYTTGRGVAQDDDKAMEWYTQAAEQGYKPAQKVVGRAYFFGDRGMEKDLAKAEEWLMKIAEKGDAESLFEAGSEIYSCARSSMIDPTIEKEWCIKSMDLYTQAAEQGYIPAQTELATIYERGYIVPQDRLKALEWYMKAAEQGDIFSQIQIGKIYRYGSGVPTDLAEAEKWYTKAAEQGSAPAQYELAQMYYYIAGETDDSIKAQEWYAKAETWYTRAAEQGYAYAQYELGNMYQHGIGVKCDDAEARKWYRKVAEQDSDYAKYAQKRLKELKSR